MPGSLLFVSMIAVFPLVEAPEVLGRAQAAFRQGVERREQPDEARPYFQEAARFFDQLYRSNIASPELCLNAGSAALLAGDLPAAILAFRRGSRLAPNDPALRTNLAYAREQVAYAEPGPLGRPAVDDRPPWLPILTRPMQLMLLFLVYTVGCVGTTRWLMTRRPFCRYLALASLLGVPLTCASLIREGWSQTRDREQPLVVIAEDGVLLRAGNGLSYSPRHETPLNRGVEARLLHRRGDWLQIELASGQVGWIPVAFALIDELP